MPPKRTETFLLALGELRARLAAGAYPSDTRFAAAELAPELGLSATPVREALSRLAGEGLLEDRRGEGFFLRRLSARDIASLYRLHESHLRIAVELGPATDSAAHGLAGLDVGDDAGVHAATEALFLEWVAAAGSRALTQSFARTQHQLARVRRLESLLLLDLVEEHRLLRETGEARMARLRAFHSRRVRRAARLAELLETRAEPPRK